MVTISLFQPHARTPPGTKYYIDSRIRWVCLSTSSGALLSIAPNDVVPKKLVEGRSTVRLLSGRRQTGKGLSRSAPRQGCSQIASHNLAGNLQCFLAPRNWYQTPFCWVNPTPQKILCTCGGDANSVSQSSYAVVVAYVRGFNFLDRTYSAR